MILLVPVIDYHNYHKKLALAVVFIYGEDWDFILLLRFPTLRAGEIQHRAQELRHLTIYPVRSYGQGSKDGHTRPFYPEPTECLFGVSLVQMGIWYIPLSTILKHLPSTRDGITELDWEQWVPLGTRVRNDLQT